MHAFVNEPKNQKYRCIFEWMNSIKYYMSYLFELPVRTLKSEQSGKLIITLHKGQLKLSTDRVVYSFGKHYHSFSRAFEKIQIQQRMLKNVLILGAGLGSILHLLEEHSTICEVTAIENDPIVLEAAHEFQSSSLSKRTNWILSDAFQYVIENKQYYDAIFFDVFIHEKTPEQFLNESFLFKLKQSLDIGGILIFSKMSNLDLLDENDVFKKRFLSVFSDSEVLHLYGNIIFIGFNTKE